MIYRFRLVLIVTLAWLMLILNVERPSFPVIGVLDLAPVVYILSAMIFIGLISLPRLARLPAHVAFLPVLAVYLLIKVAQNAQATLDVPFVYIALTELIVLYISLFIARAVSLSISHFDDAITNVVLRQEQLGVLGKYDGEEAINDEMLRARRYNRPATLLYLQFPLLKRARKPLHTWNRRKVLEHSYFKVHIAKLVRGVIFDTDIIAWNDDDLVILLPETHVREARKLLQQLTELFAYVLKIDAEIGIAQFPDDALVYGELLKAAATRTNNIDPSKSYPRKIHITPQVSSSVGGGGNIEPAGKHL